MALSHFSRFRVLDALLPASRSIYMNEWPKLGSAQDGLDDRNWVFARPNGVLLACEGSSEATANRPSERRALLP